MRPWMWAGLSSALAAGCASVADNRGAADPPANTFSIVAFDPATGELGVAVESKFLAVGAVVPYAKAGVGAIATQSYANTTYGPRGLALLEQGATPEDALGILTRADADSAVRQAGVVDAQGRAAAFTGDKCTAHAGHKVGRNFAVQGNLLTGPEVIDAMAEAFGKAEGDLADRLLAALEAGQKAGGDRRGQQSAALLVVQAGGGYAGLSDRRFDLRVDDHPKPIEELRRLLDLHRKTFRRVRKD